MKACREWREAIAAGAARAERAADGALEAHLLLCSPCRAWSEQVAAQNKALSLLSPRTAPQALDSRVLQEIHNPDLFVSRWMKKIRRIPAPMELWARVREEISVQKAQRREGRDRLRRWVRWSGAAAASLALAVGIRFFVSKPDPVRSLPLSVKDVETPDGLSVASSGIIEGAFGASGLREKR